ncbi:MAG TPA: peptidylprolyl isomerase [Brumimicrobium sp.]|nr:peptidylprolyl isomerase [Brumimicrobium sp.]
MNFKMYLLLLTSFVLLSLKGFSQKGDAVVMSVNGEEVSKSEFLQVYLKNNESPKYDKESLDEYMELYKKFKLKVAEAEALGYDTIPALVRELNGYKEQLAQPYLIDSEKTNSLINEAYERMKYEVKASHILINLSADAPPADTLKAYNKIMELRKRIVKGEDFGDVASGPGGSDDPSAVNNKGDLGYFTAFQMVYPFETAAYNTKVGEISMPVRTNFGYHLIKVFDKRDARGTITAAHIMVVTKQNADKAELENAEKKINEIYEQLESGEQFEKLARLYSDDQGSKAKGGVIPKFGSGTNQRMVTEFEDAAFALENNGDYSKPFKTDYGYHIVKRIDYAPLGTLNELKPEIKQKLNRGDRANQSEKAFINKLKKENKFVDKGEKRLTWFYENIDSSVFKNEWNAPTLKKNKWMFMYHKTKYDMQTFLDYIAAQKNRKQMPIEVFVNNKYEQWQSELIINDEKSRLKEKYPAYKALLQEYHDGVLLYEIMKDKVWDKAIKDTVGLQAYFDKNNDKYNWPERVQATIYSSDKKEMILEAQLLSEIDTLKMSDIVKKVNADSQLNIEAEQGKYIQSNHPVLTDLTLELGKNDVFEKDDKYYFIIVDEVIPAGPKALNEARGAVIQDYQEFLETEWLNELTEKHTIKVNKEVLYKIGE